MCQNRLDVHLFRSATMISTTKAGTAFQIDTAAPLTAAITGALTIDADSDNNTANDNDSATKADNLTRDTTPTLSGTTEPGATVNVFDNGTLIGTTTAFMNSRPPCIHWIRALPSVLWIWCLQRIQTNAKWNKYHPIKTQPIKDFFVSLFYKGGKF